jgi:hypothetical protein
MDKVANDEIVYRCVFYGKNLYRSEDGYLHLSSQAFADRNQMPSVDRASLRQNDPTRTQKTADDGILSLITESVRQIDTVQQMDNKGNLVQVYKIDIIADPIVGLANEDNNLAHAEIRPSPSYQNKSVFRKLGDVRLF